MILIWLIAIPIVAGVAAWISARANDEWPRILTLASLGANFMLAVALWIGRGANPRPGSRWFEEVDIAWIPHFGIRFHLGVDGLSFLLVMLTIVLGIVAVLSSWREIRTGVGFFHLNLNWILAGLIGVFLSLDLFLFYFAWELMLVPMYLLIAIWGHERRLYAAVKFFLFTQLSGLLMLVAILALVFAHRNLTGVLTFQYDELIGTPLGAAAARWIMLGFFVAFAVKLPVFPLHTWLPDAHTEAPTAGSVILAGLMLKTGGYGILRFVLPMFPGAAREFAPAAFALGVAGILYGAVQAFGQNDFKRLVAYTSVSHLGFVLVGAFAGNQLGIQGAVVTMLCHGLSTGALFVIAGAIQERTHTREFGRLGGLWSVAPFMSGAAMFFTMASLGLPGLGDFVGELLVLVGLYQAAPAWAALAAVGVLASTIYGVKLIQRVFHGPNEHRLEIPDFGPRERVVAAALMLLLVWIGLYPRPVLDTLAPVASRLQQTMEVSSDAAR